jgi:rare lipoprotein A
MEQLLREKTMSRRSRWRTAAIAAGLIAALALTSYHFSGPREKVVKFIEQGTASWYGPRFHGKKTASGERYDENDLTAAHRKLPLGSEATVTNTETGKSVQVEINDRGPYVPGRKIDLSKEAAKRLDMLDDGTARVRIEATEEQLEQGKK